jgi:hypothetical protein
MILLHEATVDSRCSSLATRKATRLHATRLQDWALTRLNRCVIRVSPIFLFLRLRGVEYLQATPELTALPRSRRTHLRSERRGLYLDFDPAG